MADLLADENIPDAVVARLRDLGHDAVTAREEGLSGRADPVVLAHAHATRRIVLTNDRDFFDLHRAGVSHSGIVYCSSDPDFAGLARRIDAALASTPDAQGRLIRVVKPNPPQVP